MTNEEKVKGVLLKWLNLYDFDVYWEKKNEFTKNTFHIKGITQKPDLYLVYKKNPTIQVVLEVKPSKHIADVIKGTKIIDYYENYVTGKTKYFIDGKEMKPRFFLLSTELSIIGKMSKYDESKRSFKIDKPYFPKFEYNASKLFIRNLWNNWRKRKLDKIKPEIGIGFLVSDLLINKDISPSFWAMFKNKSGRLCHWFVTKDWYGVCK